MPSLPVNPVIRDLLSNPATLREYYRKLVETKPAEDKSRTFTLTGPDGASHELKIFPFPSLKK